MSTAPWSMPPNHPCLAGHFPGRPLAPGVTVLDAVFQAIEAAGYGAVLRLRHAKFLAPVLPGQAVEIALTVPAPGRVGFRCLCAGVPVLTGEAETRPA